MARDVETILGEMRANPADVRFAAACKVADHYFAEFGPPRSLGTSHRVYKMPWPGDPRINLQKDGSKAKAYQVRQLVEAVDKLKGLRKVLPASAKIPPEPPSKRVTDRKAK